MKEAWKVLEFDRILTTLSTCAVSAEAQAALLALTPSADEVQCLHRMAETTEARRMLEQCGTPPFSLMENLTQHIALAQAGGMLTPERLTAWHVRGLLPPFNAVSSPGRRRKSHAQRLCR